MWRRFLNKPWTITTFTEQQWQWLFICHPLFHINLLHLVRDKEHGLLNLGTEKHRDRSFHPLTQGGGWRSMVQKANSALEKHKRTPATCITPHQSSDPFLQTLDDLSIILFEQYAHSNVAINISLVVIYIGLCKHGILSFPNHFQEFFRETHSHSQVFCRVMLKRILNKLLQHLEPHYNTQKWLQSSPCMPASPSHSLYCFKTLSTF
ncbi:uncharacterized protein C8R40DRAFT_916904 [Lentinula edodes]|uniref:uncharacterized protein n=1 Tax=Lentinula edodes TaxID=5353 RepID=UPI001E8DF86A|nr:uncharacterized protein C8R40DRAFT_916904 [Lentinula edodes]KAH7867749.1 hypothetical protein C8R40DRAFT_916904 [Lentinula edodes]